MTQTELARILGCSAVSIRKLELGERRPSKEMANLLADRIGIAREERDAFLHFARTDEEPEFFRHPVFAEPVNNVPITGAKEELTPQTVFPLDIPGWIEVGGEEVLKLADRVVTAQFHSAPVDSPHNIGLRDGRRMCKITSMGRITGELKGTIQQEITQLHGSQTNGGSIWHTAILFSIETEEGIIKGGCAGFMTGQGESTQEKVYLQGQIFMVSEKYADLLLADVRYESVVVMVPNGMEDRGVLNLVPRWR